MIGKMQAFLGVFLLSVIVLLSALAPVIAPYPPNETSMKERLEGPSYEHLLGTDALGRDMLSRILYGGRTSMMLALAATLLSMLIGMALGLIAGYWGSVADWLITALTNVFQGLPSTCLIVAIAGVLGPGIENLLLALVVTSWTDFSRIVRTETLKLKAEPFVEGLRGFGCGSMRMLLFHIVPNMMPNTIVLLATRVSRSVLSIATLSFLGLGVHPPTPDWSVMINDARMYYRSAPHLIIVPGLCIFLLLFAIQMLGDVLRDRFDVKSLEVRVD